ncbi:amidohydrolase family protein [Amycolatopsis pithecellobii]|uniref:amidohydrolase family protein n=1 Tax=Amycolatopsis pithecellobii TaxID=664692 RepID=UPI00140E4E67|nr:amidohydrolase family protein [Amycolatopsis pithecellobii]
MHANDLPPTGSTFLIRGGCVLTLDPGLGDFESANVLVRDGKIVDVGPDVEAPGVPEIDARNTIVLPGFVDTHRHLWQGILRNSVPDADLAEYMSTVHNVLAANFQPEDVYAGNYISALGALNSGVTTILDWSQVQNTPQHSDAAVDALTAAGIRAVFAFGPAAGEAGVLPDDARNIAGRRFASSDSLVTLALAAAGPEVLPADVAAHDWRLAKELDVRVAVHVGVSQYGQHRHLEQFLLDNPVGDRTLFIHGNTLCDTEWQLIADSGGAVSISSAIEMQMGHGTPPIQRALDRGLVPSLSVDVEVSIAGDFFTQMRSAFAAQRVNANELMLRGETAPALLRSHDVVNFATLAGASATGLADRTGSIAVGKQADLILLRTDLINVAPVNDAYGAIVTAMDTSNVDTVMVAGKIRKWRGKLVDVDIEKVCSEARDARERVVRRSGGKTSLLTGVLAEPARI